MNSLSRSVAIVAALVSVLALAAPAAAEVRTETFRHAVKVDGYEAKQEMTFDIGRPKVPGFVVGMSVEIVDADGSPVPIQRLMLHHVVFAAMYRPNPTCDTFLSFDNTSKFPGAAEAFYGAGEERTKLQLPPGYGYQINGNDPWAMTWMLMNHRKTRDHAFIEWKVTYDTDPNLVAVHPYGLSINNCRVDPIFNVPGGGAPGSTYSRTYEITMPESGRIVSAGGHVHGGAIGLDVTQPDCDDRRIIHLDPAWGLPGHPFYKVRPVLHEPGPIAMSGMLSAQGYPVAAGQRLKLTSTYDNEYPHLRVMGIVFVYVAPSAGPVDGCGPPPSDVQTVATTEPHRTSPPRVRVPLTGIGPNGKARSISHPPGRRNALRSGSTIVVRDYFFGRPNVAVPLGARLRWRFAGDALHNVTLADGPRGFASPNLPRGRRYAYRFRKRGTYKLYCALHPVQMTETVTVR